MPNDAKRILLKQILQNFSFPNDFFFHDINLLFQFSSNTKLCCGNWDHLAQFLNQQIKCKQSKQKITQIMNSTNVSMPQFHYNYIMKEFIDFWLLCWAEILLDVSLVMGLAGDNWIVTWKCIYLMEVKVLLRQNTRFLLL